MPAHGYGGQKKHSSKIHKLRCICVPTVRKRKGGWNSGKSVVKRNINNTFTMENVFMEWDILHQNVKMNKTSSTQTFPCSCDTFPLPLTHPFCHEKVMAPLIYNGYCKYATAWLQTLRNISSSRWQPQPILSNSSPFSLPTLLILFRKLYVDHSSYQIRQDEWVVHTFRGLSCKDYT